MQDIVPRDGLPPRVAGYLAAAAEAIKEWREAELLLWRAQATDPDCLYVYYNLYKLYAIHNRLSDAERAIYMALDISAHQAGIDSEWQLLERNACDWSRVDAPQHFYLFSLKALAFIRLRQQRLDDTNQILAKLREIDPDDSVGASVIAAYAEGALA